MSSPHPTHPSLPGTRPAGAQDDHAAARQVREMFSRIAPRYDFLNHLLSLQLDRLWRRRVARRFGHILRRADARVLDLCCGTGDLAFALAHAAEKEAGKQGRTQAGMGGQPHSDSWSRGYATIFGSDFAHPMLVRAQEKRRAGFAGPASNLPESARRSAGTGAAEGRGSRRAGEQGVAGGVQAAEVAFLEADSLVLPFADSSLDLATTAFGFRNLANYERGLAELYRVLRSGGAVGILEFSEPRGALLGPLYRFYFTRILPRVGGAISGNAAAYSYLPSSVEKFPSPEALAALMTRAGFEEVRFEPWTGGIVTLHTARRP